jgi:predicted nucleotidyltransferase component of viral defense system
MLELKQIESFYPGPLRPFKRNMLREYLQYKILEAIFTSRFTEGLVFMGGTAIHIIHGNQRFSEDLDFDNLKLSKRDFQVLSAVIQKKLKLEGYSVGINNSFKQAYSLSVRFANLLYENGLSKHKEEKLLIKVDAEPQKFKYIQDKVILNKFDVFVRINSVPIGLLLSQKIYAIFKRNRPIGRDFYDALFLFSKTKPDFRYLTAKLNIRNKVILKKKLLEKCQRLNFKGLAADVEQFLYAPGEASRILLFPEFIEKSAFV